MENFDLCQTFCNEQDGFRITPIYIDGDPIFIPQEIEGYLDYPELANNIVKNKGLVEGEDYLVLKQSKLKQFKELLRSVNDIHRPPQVFGRIRFAPSLVVLTESGFFAIAFRSSKDECIRFRLWVTKEVLPQIRKTGGYQLPQNEQQIMAQALQISNRVIAELKGQVQEQGQKLLTTEKKVEKLEENSKIDKKQIAYLCNQSQVSVCRHKIKESARLVKEHCRFPDYKAAQQFIYSNFWKASRFPLQKKWKLERERTGKKITLCDFILESGLAEKYLAVVDAILAVPFMGFPPIPRQGDLF